MRSLWKSGLLSVLLLAPVGLTHAERPQPLSIERLREEMKKPVDQQSEVVRGVIKVLSKSQVPTEDDAKKLALGAFVQQVGLDAREKWSVTQLFKIGRDVPEFAKEGDHVWEVRMTRQGDDHVSGVVWVSTTTKTARVLFPIGK